MEDFHLFNHNVRLSWIAGKAQFPCRPESGLVRLKPDQSKKQWVEPGITPGAPFTTGRACLHASGDQRTTCLPSWQLSIGGYAAIPFAAGTAPDDLLLSLENS